MQVKRVQVAAADRLVALKYSLEYRPKKTLWSADHEIEIYPGNDLVNV